MMGDQRSRSRGSAWTLVVALVAFFLPVAGADEPPLPTPEAVPAAPDDPRVLAEQVRQLMEMNRSLSNQLGDLSRKYDDLAKKVDASSSGDRTGPTRVPSRSGDGAGGPTGDGSTTGNSASRPAGGGTAGGLRDPDVAQGIGNRRLGRLKIQNFYDHDRDGFLMASDDDEYQLKIRTLIQADAHIFQQTNQSPVSSGLYLPRARMYLSGRITKPIEYQIAYQRNYDSFDLLNAFINYNYDDRLTFRIGRFKTPYSYEYYKIEVQNLLAPERSVFNLNFQGTRQVGAMAYGQLYGKRLEYAVGTFDGARNGFQAFHNGQDVMAFLNFRPFLGTESPLTNLNVGGSVDYGSEDNPVSPSVYRTTQQVSNTGITSTAATNSANVPFFAFNSNVKERGAREQWELHAAYFYKGLSLLAAWDSGFNSFALTTPNAGPVAIPIEGYFVQVAYLVTGETRNDNGLIDPLRPFDVRAGKFGLGAIEPTARFSTVHLDKRIFDAGFADPNLWTNSALVTDVGFNWYLNKFAKVYFDWHHDEFGSPVFYRPGARQLNSDLFWLRFQLYF
jgi:phosphate-selective porin OprO/OprP